MLLLRQSSPGMCCLEPMPQPLNAPAPYSTAHLHTCTPAHLHYGAACLQAVDALVRVQAELVDYSVNSVTGGR